ncbi:MAG TPA: G1 family glutamic endopeptidase [Gaiellaceae bacterium]|nr:G1 family glutamic endopeptidase [Gaiellaceae bacterium]
MRRRYLCGAFVGVLVIAAALSASAGGATPSMWHGPVHMRTNSTSTNWSGYAVTGGRYTSVSSSWTQPSASCSGTAYSSFWVGLDGDTSGTVEQTGTDADCSGATPRYYAWYEMYPKYPVNYSNTVRPGDHMSASVTTNGAGSFTLTISDSTQGWSKTTTARLRSAKLASAEVIAEAPSSSGGVLPLANFGTVGFSGAKANGSVLTSTTFGLDKITMQSGSTVKAQPSSMSSGSFSVAWKHA